MTGDDDEVVPDEFRTFADRHDLDYRQTPPGLALYFGAGALFLGVLLAGFPGDASDRELGYLLLAVGGVLLAASAVLHRRMRRREEELRRAYLRWRREQRGWGPDW